MTSQTLSISPGASASTTLQVTSPATAVNGFYDVGVTATNSADTTSTASTVATVVLVSALDVSVATDQSSYTRNQSVVITAVVHANGSPVANASVTFTVTKPNGAVVQQTAITGATGTAVYKLRLKQMDPVGPYLVRTDATLNGISGSATTGFTVQ